MNIRNRFSGSALLTVVLFSAGLALILAALISATTQSYRLEKINEARATERAIAESELELIYYQFKNVLTANKNVDIVPSSIGAGLVDYSDSTGHSGVSLVTATAGQPTTVRSTFLPIFRPDTSNPLGSTHNWTVMRSLTYTVGDKVDGSIGGSNSGHHYYMTAEVEVIPTTSLAAQGVSHLRLGRQFVYSVYTILQYGLFYQGDLEMTPGTSFDIKGDIAVNGSIYMGSPNAIDGSTSYQLNIFGKVSRLGNFNVDSLGNTTYFKPPDTLGQQYFHTAINSAMTTITPPIWQTSQATQLSTAPGPINFLGGLDVPSAKASNPTLFPDDNSVYRAIIMPPPMLLDSSGNYTIPDTVDYPPTPPSDDPKIATARLYDMASLIVTITGGSVTVQEVDGNGVPQAASQYASAVSPPTSMYDAREGKPVTVTNIDVSQLISQGLQSDPNFQGVVYVNQVGTSSATPMAIRLINGASTPQKAATASSDAVGFTVATNGGMYVQGNYNTVTSSNPTVLLADAVTALSAGWTDANSSLPLSSRKSASDLTINSAILTGNTPTTLATATPPSTSGGAQNLVRYLEDWSSGSRSVTLKGSLGRLFDSKSFIGAYGTSGVYSTPTRNIVFDPNLSKSTPKGAPSVKSYSRGAYFYY